MSQRTVAVSLTAQVAGYVAGMEQARKKTAEVGTTAEQAKAKLESQSAAMTQLGTGLLAVGALAAVGVGLAVKKFAEFDSAMSEVQASTHESAANMGLLRDAALEAGAVTVFSATEAANAIDELAKAGVSTAAILGGALKGSLDLASAGGLGVAEAAATMATAMTQFKQPGESAAHIADLLAAGAGKAQGSVSELSQALAQGGLVASQAGFSIEETTGALAAFASAGLIGSDAGTSLKTAILALEKPSKAAQDAMDQYGISVYDGQGKMLSMSGIAGQLKSKLGGLTDEQRNSTLATIFGTDAVRSAAVLYDQGAKGIQAWNDKVNDSGYAAETARLKLDNLNGDVEALGGSFDTALIKTGAAANDSLRFLTQTATELVNAFGDAPVPVQQTAMALGVVIAATALAGGGFLLAVPKIAEFSTALATLSASSIPGVAAAAVGMQGAITKSGAAMAAAAKFMTGPWGLALAAATVGVALLAKTLDSLQASGEEVRNALSTASSAAEVLSVVGQGKEWKWLNGAKEQLKDLPAVLQASADQSGNLFARFDQTNFGAFDALRQIGDELAGLSGSDLPGAQHAFQMLTEQTDGTEQAQWRLLNTMPAYKDALIAQATNLGINVTSTDEAANKTALLELAFGSIETPALDAATAYLAAADEASGLNDQVKALMDIVAEANGVNQDAVSANLDYQNALADVKNEMENLDPVTGQTLDTVSKFQATLDLGSQAGRDNMAMLVDLAAKSQTAADATFAADGSTTGYKTALDNGRQAIYDTAVAMGANADEANRIADNLAKIPPEKQIKLIADTAAAAAQLQHIRDLIQNMPGAVAVGPGVTIRDPLIYGDGKANGGTITGFSTGGTARGPGTSKSDSIPTMLSVGEEVIQEPYATQYRAVLKQINAGNYQPPTFVQAPAQQFQSVGASSTDNSRSNTFQISGEGMSPREVAEAIAFRTNQGLRGAL